MRYIKTFIVAVFAVCAVPVFGTVSASTLDTDRSVFGISGTTISPTVTNTTTDSGDRYVAAKTPSGTLFFHAADGTWTTTATPDAADQTFSGTDSLFQADSQALPAGNYQIFEVVTDPGADIFDSSLWHETLNSINCSVGQPATVSNDFDDDGWPDDDANHDGFHDDDANHDGFHDDDINKDGFHEDDINHDGFHESDTNHDGYSEDDLNHDGFHDGDINKDGFAENDLNKDGFHDGDTNHDGFDDSDINHDGFDDGDTNHDGTVDTEDSGTEGGADD